MLTVGATLGELTVILDDTLVVTPPRLSVARAVSVYVPAATPLQVKLYGAVVSSPSFVVPLKNSTLVTVPSASEAVAARFTVAGAVKVAPLLGCVSVTVGAALLELTVIAEARLVVTPPRSSVARAVSE